MRDIGICGILCSECSLFQRECMGCLKELKIHPSQKCDVIVCAIERGIATCEECPEDMNHCLKAKEHRSFCPLLVAKTTKFQLNL
ncbi:MAG: hypothetical protein GKC03_02095 [Methanomassiliicoccales archaeon]|nr:hypothetical protein [Methanomassiliicoccales archaeon]NYT15149.1 hypothetical protein [Methanomassiliicoccales archaeon]